MRYVDLNYRDLSKCDRCGQPLAEREWISGVCSRCQEAETAPKGRTVEPLKPRKGLLGSSR